MLHSGKDVSRRRSTPKAHSGIRKRASAPPRLSHPITVPAAGGGGRKRARSTRIDRYGRIRKIKSRGGGVTVLAVCVNSDRWRFAGCVSGEMIKDLFRMGVRGVLAPFYGARMGL